MNGNNHRGPAWYSTRGADTAGKERPRALDVLRRKGHKKNGAIDPSPAVCVLDDNKMVLQFVDRGTLLKAIRILGQPDHKIEIYESEETP